MIKQELVDTIKQELVDMIKQGLVSVIQQKLVSMMKRVGGQIKISANCPSVINPGMLFHQISACLLMIYLTASKLQQKVFLPESVIYNAYT